MLQQQNGQNNPVLTSDQVFVMTSATNVRCSASEKMFFIASAIAILWQFCPPVNYDKILTQFYGDYMQLPPEDKRTKTHDYELYDLEDK